MVLLLLGIVLILVGLIARNANAIIQQYAKYFTMGGGLLAVIGLLTTTIRIIEPGRVGVQVLFGEVKTSVLLSGMNFINPFVKIDEYDITLQNYTMSEKEKEGQLVGDDAIQTLSSDGLTVVIDMTVSYTIDPERVIEIRKTIGAQNSYVEKVIRPNARTRIRESAAQYNAIELYSTKRDSFQQKIMESITKDFAKNGIILKEVLIRNINLPESVKTAIEAKINAEQESQKMEFVLTKEKQEAERKQVEARGIAEYQRIINSTLTDKQISYETIKAMMELSKSQNAKIIFLGGGKVNPSVLLGGN